MPSDPYREACEQIRKTAKRTADYAKFWLVIGPLLGGLILVLAIARPGAGAGPPGEGIGEQATQAAMGGILLVLAVASWFQRRLAIRLQVVSPSEPTASVATRLHHMLLSGIPGALVGLLVVLGFGLQAAVSGGLALLNPCGWLWFITIGLLPNYLLVRTWLLGFRLRAAAS